MKKKDASAAGWVIHPASAGEEGKQGARALNYSIKQEKGSKQAWRPGTEPLCGADQSSVPRGLRWQSQPLPQNIRWKVRGPRQMTEIKRLGSALQAQKNGFVRKSTCRSQSQHQHFAIRSFLREALRAKPKMSWRRLYLIKSAKLISEALKKGKTHGQREGCRSASRSHGIRKNEKQDFRNYGNLGRFPEVH